MVDTMIFDANTITLVLVSLLGLHPCFSFLTLILLFTFLLRKGDQKVQEPSNFLFPGWPCVIRERKGPQKSV